MTRRVLVLGYGNPGRRDDGLGPALARAIDARGIPGVCVETRYQLQIEDAATAAGYDAVVFADADRSAEVPFTWTTVDPRDAPTFTTHSVPPHTVLALAHAHFGCRTDGFLLGIRGHEFDDFGEGLSPRAKHDLAEAVDHLEHALRAAPLNQQTVSPTR